ncbi:hypothetical protein VP01_3766g2 [Puccinia sorghi]|uniref:Uncharacterized protein n=1 Tax=Puccinia sorghi TaxID=27349 RepID=A0A0L6UTV8_9BASI|nr:hypothetical protein VP01_3766g2 [Puccinia sorghi]
MVPQVHFNHALRIQFLSKLALAKRSRDAGLRAITNLAYGLGVSRLPLDFYDSSWFNSLDPSVKDTIANVERVAFLPNVSDALRAERHKHEKLSYRKFIKLFFQQLTGAYDLSGMSIYDDNKHE